VTGPGGDVEVVEVGHRPPWRWLAAAAVAVWVVAAVGVSLRGGGGDGGDPQAAVATSTSSSTSTTRPTTTTSSTTSTTRPPTTTTTLFVAGAPLLGEPSGFDLIVSTSQRTYVLDLDTGETAPFPSDGVARIDADGLFATDGDGVTRWHPFPLDGGAGVPVTDFPRQELLRVPGADRTYTVHWDEETGVPHVRLVTLADGAVTQSFDLPREAGYAFAVETGLVIAAGGDTYLATGSAISRVATGELMAAGGRTAYLRRCDERLRCGLVAHDVVTGGEKVWPDPVERILRQLPGVADVAVVGRPDPEWGQAVTAVVVVAPAGGATAPTLDAVRDAVRAELGPWCCPRRLELVDALPRTALGKVRRAAL
jgi:acyl-CoA synthetase (AMP-forming)/AMP-acid ligase II